MRFVVLFLVVFMALTGVVGCGGKYPLEKWALQVHPEVLEQAGLEYYWHVQLPMNKGETIVKLYLLDEKLYCLTSENSLLAMDAANGEMVWPAPISRPDQTVFRPTHVQDVFVSEKVSGISDILSPEAKNRPDPFDGVIINTLSEMVLINRDSGKEMRRIPFRFAANTGGASDGRAFFVGAHDGRYRAIMLQEAVKTWTRSAGRIISAPLVYADGLLFVGGEDNIFRAVYTNGDRKWEQTLNGPVTAAFYVDDRACFVPCEDNNIYAFAPFDGEKLWDPFVCQGPLRHPIQVGQNTIFQLAVRDKFYAVNLATGKERWSLPEGRLVLSVMDGKVYLLDADHNLMILDEILGAVNVSLPMTGYDVFAANTTAPAVYAATSDGLIVCIRPIAAGHLSEKMLRPDNY